MHGITKTLKAMSILEIIAHHVWDDNYPLRYESRTRVTERRIRDFERCYPKIWSRKAKDLSDLSGEYGACKFLLKQGSKYTIYRRAIIEIAAANGDVETVELLLGIIPNPGNLSVCGAEGGHMEIVLKYSSPPNLHREACMAAKHNHVQILDWCFGIMEKKIKYHDIAAAAASGGHLKLVKRCVNGGARNYLEMAAAARNGHFNIIKYTEGKYKEYSIIAISAARGGQLAVIKYIYDKISGNNKLLSRMCIAAAQGGHANVFMHCMTEPCAKSYHGCAYDAVYGGNLQIVSYMLEHGASASRLLPHCAKYGRIDIMKFIYTNYSETIDEDLEDLVSIAVVNGNIEILEYLYDRGASIPEREAVTAASFGYLEIVEFMVKKGATNYQEIYTASKKRQHDHITEYMMVYKCK